MKPIWHLLNLLNFPWEWPRYVYWILFPDPNRLTREDVAATIDAFLSGGGGPYDWRNFVDFKLADPELEEMRKRCAQIDYRTEQGRAKLREELQRIRQVPD